MSFTAPILTGILKQEKTCILKVNASIKIYFQVLVAF